MPKKSINQKVAFARHAVTAQRAVETDITSLATQPIPSGPTHHTSLDTQPILTAQSSGTKVGIPSPPHGKAGRPPKPPQYNLPPGYKMLRRGLATYSDDLAETFIDAYYLHAGSITRACRECGIRYHSVLAWRETIPEFKRALEEVDEIIKDEVHSQFMERVLTTWEPNPTWKLTYFKKHFPQYSETKKSAKFVFHIKDTLIKPDYIDGEVIPPKQLESSNEPGPKQAVDSSSDSGKVS